VFECAHAEGCHGGLAVGAALERRAGRGKAVARAVECQGGAADRALHVVERRRHLADLVAAAYLHRIYVRARVRAVEVTARERLHGAREVGNRPLRQPLGGRRDLRDGVGDHARKDQPDGDGQDRHGDEDVLEHRDEHGVAVADVRHREQVAGAIERHHGHHRTRQLRVHGAQ
jgi:hypothetical protein